MSIHPRGTFAGHPERTTEVQYSSRLKNAIVIKFKLEVADVRASVALQFSDRGFAALRALGSSQDMLAVPSGDRSRDMRLTEGLGS
jgi:hypothetical protein